MTTDAAPPRPDNIGKTRRIKSITGKPVVFNVVDEIIVPQGLGKLIYFQQLRHEPDGMLEYRLCYYMLGVREARRGQWVFGQYALMVSAETLVHLIAEAKHRGWNGLA